MNRLAQKRTMETPLYALGQMARCMRAHAVAVRRAGFFLTLLANASDFWNCKIRAMVMSGSRRFRKRHAPEFRCSPGQASGHTTGMVLIASLYAAPCGV